MSKRKWDYRWDVEKSECSLWAGSWLTLFEELVDALRRRRCGDGEREGTSDGGQWRRCRPAHGCDRL